MDDAEIGLRAKAMYDSRPSRAHCPAWEQLGPGTQSVWRGYVLKELAQQEAGALPGASSNQEGSE